MKNSKNKLLRFLRVEKRYPLVGLAVLWLCASIPLLSQDIILVSESELAGNGGAPELVDIDGDGDLDLFVSGDILLFFRNIGSSAEPIFEAAPIPSGLSSAQEDYSYHAFGDIDGDGDYDVAMMWL